MTAPTTETPKRSASAEILERLRSIHAAVIGVHRLASLRYNPQDMRIYKPTKSNSGTALSLDLRLEPTFEKSYVKSVAGGLFLVLAGQKPAQDANGNATFDWDNAITAKLGVVDLSSLLTGYEAVRLHKKKVPDSLRPKQRKPETDGSIVSLFHVFEGEDSKNTTGISWQFKADGSEIYVSRAKDNWRRINMTLPEELRFRQALLRALDALEELGVR